MYWWRVVLTVGCVVGCANEHDHDVDHGDEDEHTVRDPVTEPCDASNWAALFPDLRACELSGLVLDRAPLRRVDLSDAQLSGTSFIGADLFQANLQRAKLANANFSGAKLTGADLAGVDLTDAITDATTICVLGNPGPCW